MAELARPSVGCVAKISSVSYRAPISDLAGNGRANGPTGIGLWAYIELGVSRCLLSVDSLFSSSSMRSSS